MSTSNTPIAHPGYRPYLVSVTRLVNLSPHFVRVTLASPELSDFGTARLDQRIKLIFPRPGVGLVDFGYSEPSVIAAGDWFRRWRAVGTDRRNPMRTFTIKHVRAAECEIDVDFVRHGRVPQVADGPAAEWLRQVALGDKLVVVGPDSLSPDSHSGITWKPGTARHIVLAGDETAVPAIANIVDTLGDTVQADAFIEVGSPADALPMPGVACVNWFCRGDGEFGSAVVPAIDEWAQAAKRDGVAAAPGQDLADVDIDNQTLWEIPEQAPDDLYIWLAGEAGMVKTLRQLLVQDHGFAKTRIAFMGYWRRGRAEPQ